MELCEKSKIGVMDGFEKSAAMIETNSLALAKAAVILSESVIHFCLKVLLNDSETQKEKDKKRGLLVSRWGMIISGDMGMQVDMVQPFLQRMAEKFIRTAPPQGSR